MTIPAEKKDAAILEYKLNFQKFAQDCEKVRNHNTAMIEPLIFRPGQQVMHDIAEKRKKEMGYLRIMLLKNRRFGGSTYIGGRGYHRASMNFNQSIFIIAHEEKATQTLYRMVQLMQEKNPLAPSTITSNAIELRFDRRDGKGLKSEYSLATAKNVEAGRSQGIHFLHASEEASYPGNAEELLASLFTCVPRPPADTEIWRESTGKGYGNSFQKAVFKTYAEGKYPYFTARINKYAKHMPNASMEFTFAYKNPDSAWILIFIPWFLDPACQLDFENDEREREFLKRIANARKHKDDINYGVEELQRKYGLTLKQLYWREWSINNECNSDIEMFKQENPLSVQEAFRSTGKGHYNADFCDMVEKTCMPPLLVGNLVREKGVPRIEINPAGHMSIWEFYEPLQQYFLTVDAAGGKREIHVKENKDPDRTVIDVWNRRTGRQCAQWYGHVDYDLISDVVKAIGEMYGMATACVELNNHGYKVVGDLKTDDYPMYSHKPGEFGWLTNKKTKPQMADGLLDGCRDGIITIRCKETVEEMRTYIEKSGKFGAEAGCHDDRVTSAQMARQMMDLLPRNAAPTDEEYIDDEEINSETAWMAH